MAPWRRWWDRYRHFRAAQGLIQDILVFLGWKKALGAALIGVFAFVSARLSHLVPIEQFVLALGAFAFVLAILNSVGIGSGGGLQWHRPRFLRHRPTVPSLDFEAWHTAVPHLGYPAKLGNGAPVWGVIKNSALNLALTAKNVSVRVEWINDSRGSRVEVPEAAWYIASHSNASEGIDEAGWSSRPDLDGGESQSFVTLCDRCGWASMDMEGYCVARGSP
jgi:hypothetical protein